VVTSLRGSGALFAIVLAAAAFIVAPQATPVDRALPFVAVLLSIVCFTTEAQSTQSLCALCASVVILPPVLFTDEHTRLLAYGIVAAIVFAIALANAAEERRVLIVVSGVLLLRWIPLANVVVWRELIVLAGALAIFVASRSALFALAVSAVTPAFPARAMIVPFLAAVVVAVLPPIRLPAVIRVPLFASAIALMTLWPWSGILARALPAFLRARPAPGSSRPVWIALAPGQSVSIDAPPGARRAEITTSAANAARLRKGTLMGTAEGVPLRIGDIADFGYTRREQFWHSRNAAPKVPLADVKDYGQAAWLHTAALITVPLRGGALHVSAARDLPPNARLQIEAVAFE